MLDRRNGKLLLVFLLAAVLSSFFAIGTFACTGIYVGSKASDDGSIIIARSSDNKGVDATRISITERVDNEPGRTMPLSYGGKSIPIPATTYKYTSTPLMDSVQSEDKIGSDDATCSNEYGVSMTTSVTALTRQEALKADPLVMDGLAEEYTNNLIICQSRSARDAVKLLCSIFDEYGSKEINIAMIADKREAWYIENYTGHQYAAVKLPDDMVSVYGNEFSLEYLSDYEECIVSEDLIKLAEDNGFAEYGRNGEMNIYETYSGVRMRGDYDHPRTWIGHHILAPSTYGDYSFEETYPLCFKSEKKVSVKDVFAIMRNRLEGTDMSPDETGRTDVRVAGTDVAASVHVVQIHPELPASMACVTWVSIGPAMCGMFVPVSNASNCIAEGYNRNQSAGEGRAYKPDEYAWYAFKAVNVIALTDYYALGLPVKEYFIKCEDNEIKGMETLLKEAAKVYKNDRSKAYSMITDYCCMAQENAFEDANQILSDQMLAKCADSYTLRHEFDYDTDWILDEMMVPTKVSISPNPDRYKYKR